MRLVWSTNCAHGAYIALLILSNFILSYISRGRERERNREIDMCIIKKYLIAICS